MMGRRMISRYQRMLLTALTITSLWFAATTRTTFLLRLSTACASQFGVAHLRVPPSYTPHSGLPDVIDRWGHLPLDMGIAYEGSGHRIRKVLQKLASGQPISFAAIGGSVTLGHGLDLEAGEKTWSDLVFDWINTTYPHTDHLYINGAVPATSTDYFASCYALHVPEDADLYILEAAINDAFIAMYRDKDAKFDATDYTETLVRELLVTPQDPAVLMLSAWSLPFTYHNGADYHAVVSEYYDIPRVSSRPYLYKYLLQHPDEQGLHYGEDMAHPSQLGHRYLADLVIYLLQKEKNKLEIGIEGLYRQHGSAAMSTYDFRIPALGLRQRHYEDPLPESQASCLTANIRTVDGHWGLNPSANKGFYQLEANDKSWWAADEAGAIITFDNVEVHGGRVGIFYMRSDPSSNLGDLFCWVDDMKDQGATFVGPWHYVTVGSYGGIQSGLSQGTHSVTCEVVKGDNGNTHVRIIAIMST